MPDTFSHTRPVALPMESGIAHLYENTDLADAYAIAIPDTATQDINVLARSVFGSPAPWFRALLGIRDAIMAGFGVKTSRQIRGEVLAEGADHIDFFRVQSRSEHELVFGEDDRHLDFRASVLLRAMPNGAGRELIVTTAVHCRNRLGRFYLALISPFHRLVVRSNLRSAALKGWPTT